MKSHAAGTSRRAVSQRMDGLDEAISVQDRLLTMVSRTFAITIPELPPPLRLAVTNAYLLCRIADTIEDETDLTPEQKAVYGEAFVAVVAGHISAVQFSTDLVAHLAQSAPLAERELVESLPRVLEVTQALNAQQVKTILGCLATMTRGMAFYQSAVSAGGLKSLGELSDYCYHVAGVVGEMLTEMIVDHEPDFRPLNRDLERLSVLWGCGLQLTNIIKDQWEDRARMISWLPQDLFNEKDIRIENLWEVRKGAGFAEVTVSIVGLAVSQLRGGLDYALLMSGRQAGIRRFCFLSIGFALLTLRKVRANPGFSSGDEVKISRMSVRLVIFATRLLGQSNICMKLLFDLVSHGLAAKDGGVDNRFVRSPAIVKGRPACRIDP